MCSCTGWRCTSTPASAEIRIWVWKSHSYLFPAPAFHFPFIILSIQCCLYWVLHCRLGVQNGPELFPKLIEVLPSLQSLQHLEWVFCGGFLSQVGSKLKILRFFFFFQSWEKPNRRLWSWEAIWRFTVFGMSEIAKVSFEAFMPLNITHIYRV